MTIDELATATTASGQQLHKSTLSKLESGERRLTVRMAEAIAAVLSVPVGELSAPSERPLVLMVPIIGWEDIGDAVAGKDISSNDVVPVIGAQTSRLIAMRLTEDDVSLSWRSALCLDGIAIIRIGDDDDDDAVGVFIAQWGRYHGLVYYDGDGYKDVSKPEAEAYISSTPRINGRVLQCIVEPQIMRPRKP